MNPARTPLVAGNWKMHKGPAEARAFAQELLAQVANDKVEMTKAGGPEVAVFPPFTALPAVREVLRGTQVTYGGQNCHWEVKGAFTGEVAPVFLAELGCRYVLIGHSERRSLFGETDDGCRRKLAAVAAAGIEPVLCCGETLSERESGKTTAVVERQLEVALTGLAADVRFTVAYEPVWAIGTGRTATPGQAEEVHRFIRDWLGRNLSPAVAERTRLLYGGSVKPDNLGDLLRQANVDGALVGGASLEANSLAAIVKGALR